MANSAAAENLNVTITDPGNQVRYDQDNDVIETTTPDGGVVVQFGGARQAASQDEEEDDFYRNLADEMDDATLGGLAEEMIEAIEADDKSRNDYLLVRKRGIDLLGLKLEAPKGNADSPSGGIDGISSVTNPLLLEACLRGWANATAELLPASGPVKIRDDGDNTAATDDMAERLERDMNHYLTKTAPEYYPDTSQMLLWGTYFGGSGFKKIYRCPMRRRPVSESVDAQHLIVSDTTKDLKACGRITHEITMRPSVMKRMMFIGAYRNTELVQPTQQQPNPVGQAIAGIQGTGTQTKRPEDEPYTLYETQCEMDFPEFAPDDYAEESIPLPYIVTIDKNSRKVLAIRRDWKEDDPDCKRRQMYVKYPYVPGPGFYGTGLVNILGNSTSAMTAAWREALDAGMYASFPGGLMARMSGRQDSNRMTLSPGEWKLIDTGGKPITDTVMGLPYRDVTPGLMALMDKITEQSRSLGAAADLPTTEGVANVPVGTMLAQIEQATKVISAAHRGMHTAQAEEFDLLLELFRENPEDFWRSNDICPENYWSKEKFIQAIDNCKLVPCSDPNVPSHVHRVGKAVALGQLISMPAFTPLMNPQETLKRILGAIREDPNGLVQEPPPAGPSLLEQAAKTQADAKMKDADNRPKAEALKAGLKSNELQSRERIAAFSNQTKKDVEQLRLAQKLADRGAGFGDASHQRIMDLSAHMLDRQKHGLAVRQFVHDAQIDRANVAVDLLKAKNAGSRPKP